MKLGPNHLHMSYFTPRIHVGGRTIEWSYTQNVTVFSRCNTYTLIKTVRV